MDLITYEQLKNLYNCMLCAQQILGPASNILPGRCAMRTFMMKKGIQKPGNPCLWKECLTILNESHLIEIIPNKSTRLINYTIGEFMNTIQIGLNKTNIFIPSNVEDSSISNSNNKPGYITHNRRKQLRPRKAAIY